MSDANTKSDDRPASAEVCEDCGLPLAPERKTRGAKVDLMQCGARFSTYYELHCKRVAVAKLRAEVEALRARVAEQAWVARSERMPELSERVWFVAQDGAGLVRKGEFNGDRFVTSGFSWEPDEVSHWMHRLLEPARPSPPSNPDTTATKEGE